ncbi:glycosyltransferase family 9 protein, partial [Rhodopila globiformis]
MTRAEEIEPIASPAGARPGPAPVSAPVFPPVFAPVTHPVAVVQPLPGIGDMVWHLPHIRAIAACIGEPVTLITKPRSLADELFAGDPAVAEVFWIDLNPAGRRGAHDGIRGFLRLVRKLRAHAFGTLIMLHHSTLIAAAALAAGIPDRRGYGFGRQRLFLNQGPFLPPEVARLHQHTRATRYLEAAGIPLPSSEPRLGVPMAMRTEARARLGDGRPRFVAVGIGSSERLRQWGPDRFAGLVGALLAAGWPMVVLSGGREDARLAELITGALGERSRRVRLALGWHLRDVQGMLAEADFYVGNNTGVMNIAAAVGTRTYALFGTTPPFHHASQIVPIAAPDIGVHDGMDRLTLEVVLAEIGA